MIKHLYFLLLFLAANLVLAQEKVSLQKELRTRREGNVQKFLILFSEDKISSKLPNLAGFIENTPYFWKPDDKRANIASGVIPLQEGTLQGLNNLPITGSSQKIIVMDGGRIFEKHQEFGPNNSRITDLENGEAKYNSHATNVAGIIGARGLANFSTANGGTNAAKGVLPQVAMDSYTFSTTSKGDNYEKLQKAPSANISNHSYGINLGWDYDANGENGAGWYYPFKLYSTDPKATFFGSYHDEDEAFDKIVYANPNHIIVKSAGNYYGDGPADGDKIYVKDDNEKYRTPTPDELLPAKNCADGVNCIGWGSMAKNIIVVGAANQLGGPYTYVDENSVKRSAYSSAGPRKDGAIKPDITAVGTAMLVAGYNENKPEEIATYYIGSGTSFSAPVISGIAGALTQVAQIVKSNQNFTFKADEIKALLCHTANEAGREGPDIEFGWGLADATKAAKVIIAQSEGSAIFERKQLASGEKFVQMVSASGDELLKATISWVDPAAQPFKTVDKLLYDQSSRLVNDLDIRITDTVTQEVFFPWRLNKLSPAANAELGDNIVDNIEQIVIKNPVPDRTYRIEVSAKGQLKNDQGNASNQHFSMVVTGYNSVRTTSSFTEKPVELYPSVTSDYIHILVADDPLKVEIYDMAGRLIFSQKAENFQTFNVSHFSSGTYIVNIFTGAGNFTKKFIKR